MAKKEKAPKEKKPKKEKPKKEKPKKEKKAKKPRGKQVESESQEGGKGKKKGFNKLFLILIPVVLAVVAAGVLLIPRLLGGKREAEPPPEDFVDVLPEEDEPEGEPEGEAPEEPEEPEEPPAPVEPALEIRSTMTTSEIVSFVERLSPEVLGLEGEDMSGYTVFASEGVTLVDGNTCARINVYSKGERSGTNDIEGIYFLTRYGTRRLYRYDQVEQTVTEIPLTRAQVVEALPDEVREALEAEEQQDGAEEPAEEEAQEP